MPGMTARTVQSKYNHAELHRTGQTRTCPWLHISDSRARARAHAHIHAVAIKRESQKNREQNWKIFGGTKRRRRWCDKNHQDYHGNESTITGVDGNGVALLLWRSTENKAREREKERQCRQREQHVHKHYRGTKGGGGGGNTYP